MVIVALLVSNNCSMLLVFEMQGALLDLRNFVKNGELFGTSCTTRGEADNDPHTDICLNNSQIATHHSRDDSPGDIRLEPLGSYARTTHEISRLKACQPLVDILSSSSLPYPTLFARSFRSHCRCGSLIFQCFPADHLLAWHGIHP